ncbi:MAG: hypothetical protein WCP29_05240 [Acidobacteriota bacterium]
MKTAHIVFALMVLIPSTTQLSHAASGGQGPVTSSTASTEGKDKTIPGPHFILTVPIVLTHIPPEVDQYQVDCVVGLLKSNFYGKGGATGAIPTTTSKETGIDFRGEAEVGIFVDNATAQLLSGATEKYHCTLHLQGTAYGKTTKYLGNNGLTFQQGQSGFPIADGAPFKRVITGTLPK